MHTKVALAHGYVDGVVGATTDIELAAAEGGLADFDLSRDRDRELVVGFVGPRCHAPGRSRVALLTNFPLSA